MERNIFYSVTADAPAGLHARKVATYSPARSLRSTTTGATVFRQFRKGVFSLLERTGLCSAPRILRAECVNESDTGCRR